MEKEKTSRPILFSTEMVRQILLGNKTMTRRIVKKQPADWQTIYNFNDGTYARVGVDFESHPFKCPYGKVGDLLWVRETWQRHCDGDDSFIEWLYKADDRDLSDWVCIETGKVGIKWKPSIFMPRAASRITLEITNIRVERLQGISEDDAEKEGVENEFRVYKPEYSMLGHSGGSTYRAGFQTLWNKINGKNSWSENPFVFVIEFKKLQPVGGA